MRTETIYRSMVTLLYGFRQAISRVINEGVHMKHFVLTLAILPALAYEGITLTLTDEHGRGNAKACSYKTPIYVNSDDKVV